MTRRRGIRRSIPRSRRRALRLAWILAAAIAALWGSERAGVLGDADRAASSFTPEGKFVRVPVVRIVDGDTIRVRTSEREEAVRYIGIDTPEVRHPRLGKQPFGPEASAANRALVEGREVILVFDVAERDRYGRLLAYVYLPDGTFVNAELVARGFARVSTVPPNVRHAQDFLRLEREAREAGRGMWKGIELDR